MRKIIKKLSIMICSCLIAVCLLSTFVGTKGSVVAPIRDVELIEQNVDYQSLFEEFEDAELLYNEEEKYISFSGTQKINSSDLEDLDLVSITSDSSDYLDVKYSFEYYEDANLFILNVKIINVDGGELLDSVPGMPFINEVGDTDIAFVMDDEVVLLSEMTNNPLFENCGWFSNAWKKFTKAAAVIVTVAVVVAVVVVAAPAVVAAIPAASTIAVAGGGTALAFTGGGAAAAMTAASVAAAATLPTIAAATATSLAIAAVDAGIEASESESKKDVADDATSRNQMQKQVEKGQAPKEVDRVDKDHTGYGQDHVHFKDGTAINKDGTVYDDGHGVPNLSKKVLDWLNRNGWCLNGLKN